jgi:quinol monooxygenase YgiN
MLTVVAIAAVRPGLEQEFELRIAKLFESVASEPGCRGVTWGATENPGEYALIERFVDLAALHAHRASVHEQIQGPEVGALFVRPPMIARFIERLEVSAEA